MKPSLHRQRRRFSKSRWNATRRLLPRNNLSKREHPCSEPGRPSGEPRRPTPHQWGHGQSSVTRSPGGNHRHRVPDNRIKHGAWNIEPALNPGDLQPTYTCKLRPIDMQLSLSSDAELSSLGWKFRGCSADVLGIPWKMASAALKRLCSCSLGGLPR